MLNSLARHLLLESERLSTRLLFCLIIEDANMMWKIEAIRNSDVEVFLFFTSYFQPLSKGI